MNDEMTQRSVQNNPPETPQDDKPRDEIVLTRANKSQLIVHSRVMPAAGTFSYGEVYRDMINIERLGAIVTNPVSYTPRDPANGTRIVPLTGGAMLHTGLPNAGLKNVLKQYRNLWLMLPVPVILHLLATDVKSMQASMELIAQEDCIAAVELGLRDDISWEAAERLVKVAVSNSELPIMVRVGIQNVMDVSAAAADAGAGAIVCAAPPRGVVRDPINGRLIPGRIYGPLVKPIILNFVGLLARQHPDVPIIGAGGIHTFQDARDYIDAGAEAVQVDSVTWVKPKQLEYIARDLAGLTVTRETGALSDEWFAGMGSTTLRRRRAGDTQPHDPF